MATQQAKISNWRNELVPNIVDHLAKVTPEAPYALYPISPVSYDDGYRTVTYRDFANAINGLAWWLEKNLGPSKDFEVLGYIGPNDIRYTALLLAAVKTGYLAFFTSPRNSTAAHQALFSGLKCHTLLTPSPTPPATEAILQACSIKHLHVPSVENLLDHVHPHYSYDKKYENARTEPFVAIHTSGSTGIPKPLIWTHETAQRHSNYMAKDPPPGFISMDRLFQGKRILTTFPPFHGACLATHLVNSVPFGTVSIAPLSGAIASAEGVVNALKTTPADVALLVPSIVADLARNPELLDYVSQHIELIIYCGGDLPQSIGDIIAAKVPIQCQYGASEIGLTCQLLPAEMTKADWHYVCYHPDLGLKFEEVTPGLFELVVPRGAKYEDCQLPFTIGPSLKELQEYRSKDLLQKHPTIPNYWMWRARADDIIVFLNGEKTNPVSMEQHIVAENKDVSSALVFGMQRFQAGLLIEHASNHEALSAEEKKELIEKIWSSVQDANKVAPAHARVDKSLILLTSPDKPMIRSGKGTIQRQATIAMYADAIDKIYSEADAALSGVEKASIDATDPAQVSQFIRQAIASIDPDLPQGMDENFIALGMDSLGAIRLTRALNHGLGRSDIATSTIYNHSSVKKLTRYITGVSSVNGISSSNEHSGMESILAEYEEKLKPVTEADSKKGEVVILTGSTGSLGTHLLHASIEREDIAHIYCLNRRKNAQQIHENKARESGLSLDEHSHRVSFVHTTFNQPNLGIDEKTYEELRKTTVIIHNAWSVNFMLPLEAFRPEFDGLNNLFKLASTCSTPAKLLYISSMSSAARYQSSTGPSPIPEDVIRDFDAPFQIGYAKSKLVSELLCDAAARNLGVPTSFARVGQIAGPVNGPNPGLWNTSEWLPSLIMTSMSLGALPHDLGRELNKIDWMPVDLLAKSLVELSLDRQEGPVEGAEAFNVLGPRTTLWDNIIPNILDSVQKYTNKRMRIVTLESWLRKLHKISDEIAGDGADMVRKYPAIKLLDFYEDSMLNNERKVSWQMDRALSKSQTFKDMPAVHDAWLDQWVQAWVSEMKDSEGKQ